MFDISLVKAFVTLALSVAAIGGLFYLLKRVTRKSKSRSEALDFEILGKFPLQGKNSIFAVRVGNKKMLLGVSDQNITMLGDIDDKKVQNPTNKNFEDNSLKKHLDAFNKSRKIKAGTAIPEDDNDDISLSFASFLKSTFKKN